MQEMENLLESSRSAILATVGKEENPTMRWMTPTTVRGRTGALYAVTSRNFAKREHLAKKPESTMDDTEPVSGKGHYC